jgi:hypothetical protein
MNQINSSFTFFPLPHSMQMYWQTIASSLRDVLVDMSNINELDEQTFGYAKNAILTANSCADLYGNVIGLPFEERDIERNNYENCEIVFYNQLIMLLLHEGFRFRLQNIVREEVSIGTRYFSRFLSAVGVDVV